MNPDTMTLDECCAYVFPMLGYECGPGMEWWNPKDGNCVGASLDSIAASLPGGWVWDCAGQKEVGGWFASCSLGFDDPEKYSVGDTELLARARSAVKAWMQQKGT